MSQFLAYLAIGVAAGLTYSLLALGIVLIYKGSRVLNLAHPYFGLLGAYLCWWLYARAGYLPFHKSTHGRFVVAAILALVLVGLNGFAIEHGIMRRLRGAPRLVILVATIALAQGTLGFVQLVFERGSTNENRRVLPTLLSPRLFQVGTRYVTGAEGQAFIAAAVICAAAALFFTRTRFGVAIRAAAENGEAARLLGISVARVSVFTWVVGSVLAGIAGILITEERGSLDIATLSTGFLVRGLAAALLGGLVSLPGAVVGGLAVGIGESLLGYAFNNKQGVPETLLFLVIIGVLVFRPGGLFGKPEATEDKAALVPTIRALPSRLRGRFAAQSVRVMGAVVVVFACATSLVTGSATNDILTLVVLYAMVGVSLTVLMGYSGQVSLGHWGLTGVGAFVMADLFTRVHIPYLLSLPLTVAIGMAVSLVIGLPALRVRGLYLAVATLAFNLACEFFLFRSRLIGGSSAGVALEPPKLGPFDLHSPSGRPLFFFSVGFLLLTILVARNLANSRTGRGMFALRENEKAAATLGVRLTIYKLLAFAVSGGIAALAGALFATKSTLVAAVDWPTATSLVLVAMVMIGGLGSLSGSVLGAFVVIGLPRLLSFANPYVVSIGTGVLLILVITRARGGLAGLVQTGRERLVDSIDALEPDRLPTATPLPATPLPEPGPLPSGV